jgi:hypothetical protein
MTWDRAMRLAIFVSSIVASLAFSGAQARPDMETMSGFQCVGINIEGLHLGADDLRTGAGFPWILDAPKDGAKAISQVSSIIYVAWPIAVENGFMKAMTYDGKIGWLEQKAVRPLRRADGTIGGCTLSRRSDSRIMFHLDPGIGVKP